jgi:HKD family nuclease
MRLDVIDNSGATSMIAELRQELDTCRRARLATASLTRGGIGFIEEALRGRPKNLRIQLLVGLYNGHTEAAALRRLLSLQKRFGQYIEIRIAQNDRFHWKTYLFEGRSRSAAFVGSSNLTKDGLGVEGEFNIRLVSTNTSGAMAHIAETFDHAWEKDSVPLRTC